MDLQSANHVINKALLGIHEGEADGVREELFLDEAKGQTKIFAGPTKVHELAKALEKVRSKKDVSRGTEHVYVRGIVGLVSDLKKSKAPAWVIKAVQEKAGSIGEAKEDLGNLKPFIRALLATVKAGLKGKKGVSVSLQDRQRRYTYDVAITSPISVKMGPTRYFVDGTWLQQGKTYVQMTSPAGIKPFTLNLKGNPASIGKEAGRAIVKHFTAKGP